MTSHSRGRALRLWSLLATGLLLAGLVLAAPVALQAHQADCALGTYVVADDECQISGDISATGTHAFGHSLHILAGASIDASGGGITLNVSGDTGLDLTMDAGSAIQADDDSGPSGADASDIKIKVTGNMLMKTGSKITAQNDTGGGDGGAIDIDVDGDMTLDGHAGDSNGAYISSRKTSGAGDTGVGGDITITVGDNGPAIGDLTLGGGSSTYGSENGAKVLATGPGQSGHISIDVAGNYVSAPGSVIASGGVNGSAIQQGGRISVVAGCNLTSRGRITSKGTDRGADLVHIEGCDVLIQGLVESTGKGHTVSNNPAASGPPDNSCDGNDDNLPDEVIHDGKPRNATGCIEVWGGHITIDATGDWAGELNADIGNGGPQGTSWIDVYALHSLVVKDGGGNDRDSNNLGHTYHSTYAVHANAISGSDESPGYVTAKVKEGPLTASGMAFQASTTGAGSDGGKVVVEASGKVDLDHALIDATGDFNATGGVGIGGEIVAGSWSDGLSWEDGDGDVRPETGEIKLNACDTLSTSGTEFHGETPITSSDCDAGKPSIPSFVDFDTARWAKCGGPVPTLKVVKTPDGDTIHAGEKASFTITVTNQGPGTVENIDLDDELPGSGLTWTVDPAKTGCEIEDDKLHCDIASLADGADFSVTVSSPTDGEDCGTLNNEAFAEAEGVAKKSDTGSLMIDCQPPTPDVKVVKTGNGTINAGENASFDITVTNLGPGSAHGVILDDDLPAGIVWSLSGSDEEDCAIDTTATPDHLHCTFGTLEPDDDRSVTVSGETDDEDCGGITNIAVVSASNEAQEDTSNNTSDDTVIVRCAFITIEKAADKPSVEAGQPIGYLITVQNEGEGDATGVTVNDLLPTGAGLAWAIDGGTGADDCEIADGLLTCDFGTMASGATLTVHISSPTTVASCGTIRNTASVATMNDGSAEDTSLIAVTCGQPVPILTIGKAVAGTTEGVGGIDEADPGDTLTYTLTYDLTDGPVHAGVITDTLPVGLIYILDTATNSSEFTFDSYDSVTRVLTWKAPQVTTDGSVSYQVRVASDAAERPQPLINVATIDSDETDQDRDEEHVFITSPVAGETDRPVPPAPPTSTLDTPQGGDGRDFRIPFLLGFLGLVMILASATPRRPVRGRVPRN